jgi:hypothetical protein
LTPLKEVADLNGDGHHDIVGQHHDGTVVPWNHADLGDRTTQANPGAFWSLKDGADFNGDGKTDLLWRADGPAERYRDQEHVPATRQHWMPARYVGLAAR